MKRPFSLLLGAIMFSASVSSIFAWGGDGQRELDGTIDFG
jgi:hypothetical protein